MAFFVIIVTDNLAGVAAFGAVPLLFTVVGVGGIDPSSRCEAFSGTTISFISAIVLLLLFSKLLGSLSAIRALSELGPSILKIWTKVPRLLDPSLAGLGYWLWLLTAYNPKGNVDRSRKHKSGAGERPWPLRRRFFGLAPQSYWVLGRIAPFWPLLRDKSLLGSIKSLYLPLGHTQNQIQSEWIVDILGERPNPVPICLDTGSCVLFFSRCYQQKPWSPRGSSRRNPWIRPRSLAQLRYDVVCVEAIAGWPTHAKTKLQMEFCLTLWPRRSQNSLCIAGRIDSNPCVNYHSKSPGTGPLEFVREVLSLPWFGLAPEPPNKPLWIA